MRLLIFFSCLSMCTFAIPHEDQDSSNGDLDYALLVDQEQGIDLIRDEQAVVCACREYRGRALCAGIFSVGFIALWCVVVCARGGCVWPWEGLN